MDINFHRDALPENLAGATWIGFLRSMVTSAIAKVVNLHKGRRA